MRHDLDFPNMTPREQYIEQNYQELKMAILALDGAKAKEIYAFSFWFYNVDDDPRYPTISVGYNIEKQYKNRSEEASSEQEAKWNYAYWMQNEIAEIGGEEDEDLHQLLMDTDLYYSDEEADRAEEEDEDSLWELLLEKDAKIQTLFTDMVIELIKRLHKEGLVAAKAGKPIPILLHELEYYDLPISWTERANPTELIAEWVEFARRG